MLLTGAPIMFPLALIGWASKNRNNIIDVNLKSSAKMVSIIYGNAH